MQLDALCGSHGMRADMLMQILSVSPALNRFHEYCFGGHKWQLLIDVIFYHILIHHETVADVEIQVKYRIHREEALWDHETLVRRIIERSLEPLRRSRDSRVHRH